LASPLSWASAVSACALATLIESRFRPGAGRHQVLLPFEIDLVVWKVGLRLFDLRQSQLVACLKRQNLVVNGAELRFGAVKGDLKRILFQPVQNLTLLHGLIIVNLDRGDGARHVGRDADRVGLDIGVVSRHDLTAGYIEIAAGDQRQRQEREQ
jgi:hypothetical protein